MTHQQGDYLWRNLDNSYIDPKNLAVHLLFSPFPDQIRYST
jgi:hypothetical protein